MVKKIIDGEDLQVRIELVDENDELINYQLFQSYKITAYTDNIVSGNVYDRTDIVDYVLTMPSQDLANLNNGILRLAFEINIADSTFPDNNLTKKGVITTRYYIARGNNNNCCNCCG